MERQSPQNGAGYDERTQPRRPDQSLGELVSEMTSSVSTLLHQEVELAKVEAREELGRAKAAGVAFAVAGVAALLALIMLSVALAALLDEVMHPAIAFAIVGALWGVVAAVLALRGRRDVAAIEPLPETKKSIEEDVAWARAQRS